MQNFKVIVNSFNEAIISRSENGNIGYCNLHGLSFISSIYKWTNPNDCNQKMQKYLNKLKSMEYALKKQLHPQKSSFIKQENQILHAKIFKIYDMNQAKLSSGLSVQKQSIDLDSNLLKTLNGTHSSQAELYSLNDLFSSDVTWVEQNVFELIPEVTVEKFTFLQFRRQIVKTLFCTTEQL